MDWTREYIHTLLKSADKLEWTTQGFGMIRTYIDQQHRWRLNVWDHRLRTPGVSLIHDHPWSFTSHVIVGRIVNKRYHVATTSVLPPNYNYKHIVTGPDGDDASEVMQCRLIPQPLEIYKEGSDYWQNLTEVHETDADVGTVTINDRTPPTREYTARVFWHKNGHPWMAARPRPSTPMEVEQAISAALLRF